MAAALATMLFGLAACAASSETVSVEVTRVVTEVIVEEGEILAEGDAAISAMASGIAAQIYHGQSPRPARESGTISNNITFVAGLFGWCQVYESVVLAKHDMLSASSSC